MTGTIKNLREGFGFIHGDDTVDRFFLPTRVMGTPFSELTVGDHVEFEHEDHLKGARAKDIRVIRKVGAGTTNG